MQSKDARILRQKAASLQSPKEYPRTKPHPQDSRHQSIPDPKLHSGSMPDRISDALKNFHPSVGILNISRLSPRSQSRHPPPHIPAELLVIRTIPSSQSRLLIQQNK